LASFQICHSRIGSGLGDRRLVVDAFMGVCSSQEFAPRPVGASPQLRGKADQAARCFAFLTGSVVLFFASQLGVLLIVGTTPVAPPAPPVATTSSK